MRRPYRLIRSDRKSVAIEVKGDGAVLVRAPKAMPEWEIMQFVESKRGWLERQLARCTGNAPKLTAAELEALSRQAKQIIGELAAFYAPLVGVSYEKITIRAQRTRWGSCSSKGNLNFNCLLMLVPDAVLEYVVVHELCHRKEMNHSPRFWAEVARLLPEYQQSRHWLREYGPALMARLEL